MKLRSLAVAVIIIVSCMFLAGCGWVTVVSIDEANARNDGEVDPAAFAKEIWPQILDYAKKNCQPVEEVVPLFISDKDAAGTQYGYRLDEKSWWQFIVTGNAKVLTMNTKSKSGTLELDLEPYDGSADCIFQIGPIVKGQALRDSMPFIKFIDFKDQTEYGKISAEINRYAIENVLNPVVVPDEDGKPTIDMAGKIISFTGAFTAEPGKGILIIPVELAISEE